MLYFGVVGKHYFQHINQLLNAAENDATLFEAIVNAPFHDPVSATDLDLGIVVFLLVNHESRTIDRIALSNTELAAGAVRMSEKPFREIKIPLGYEGNLIARAIDTGKPQFVTDWQYLFIPALNARAARFNQAGAGIEFSGIYPLTSREGAIIFSFYQSSSNIGAKHRHFMQAYAQAVDEALQR